MICRTPMLTTQNLNHLNILVRLNWINVMGLRLHNGLTVARSEAEILTSLCQGTDLFRPLFDPLVLWAFQLKINQADQVRTIMRPDLHEEFLKLAKNTELNFDITALTPEIQATWEALEAGRQDLIRVLEDAPAVDPELAVKEVPPSGRTPTTLN